MLHVVLIGFDTAHHSIIVSDLLSSSKRKHPKRCSLHCCSSPTSLVRDAPYTASKHLNPVANFKSRTIPWKYGWSMFMQSLGQRNWHKGHFMYISNNMNESQTSFAVLPLNIYLHPHMYIAIMQQWWITCLFPLPCWIWQSPSYILFDTNVQWNRQINQLAFSFLFY